MKHELRRKVYSTIVKEAWVYTASFSSSSSASSFSLFIRPLETSCGPYGPPGQNPCGGAISWDPGQPP
eukprot:8772567-Pyramimonas_sp.AAC.1